MSVGIILIFMMYEICKVLIDHTMTSFDLSTRRIMAALFSEIFPGLFPLWEGTTEIY